MFLLDTRNETLHSLIKEHSLLSGKLLRTLVGLHRLKPRSLQGLLQISDLSSRVELFLPCSSDLTPQLLDLLLIATQPSLKKINLVLTTFVLSLRLQDLFSKILNNSPASP